MLGVGTAAAGETEAVEGYIDTAYGRNPYVLPAEHARPLSNMRGVIRVWQRTSRCCSAATGAQ